MSWLEVARMKTPRNSHGLSIIPGKIWSLDIIKLSFQCQLTAAGLTGPTGRSVARSVEKEFRVVNDPAVTRQLNTGGRSVRERILKFADATIIQVKVRGN